MSERIVKSSQLPVHAVNFTIEAGALNVCDVTCQLVDQNGNDIEQIMPIRVWLSDDVNGLGVAAVAPSVGAGAASGGGAVLIETVTDICFEGVTNGYGQFKLSINDAVTISYYVAASPLAGPIGFVDVSRLLVAADYGV